AAIEQQLMAYQKLVARVTTDQKVNSTLEDFESLFFNNMILVLDRYFVHRLRMVAGKDKSTQRSRNAG
ncbi:hypothetical protein, partial [Alicyclobacillus shizuokensis]|uniref:hypothetical protein n=1 Tax=Alicyclobacillus shizuokensis TaxID=392014 RepID=UPI000B11A4DF